MKYNQEFNKSIEKKEKRKLNSKDLAVKLSEVDLNSLFPSYYISPNGKTINDFRRMISNLCSCQSSVLYNVKKQVNTTTGEISERWRTMEMNACSNYSLCPSCAAMRSQKISNDIKPHIMTAKKMSGFNFYMLTATIENYHSKDSGEAYDKLRTGWTRFMKMGQLRERGRSRGEAAKIKGYVMSIENVPSKSKKGYVHVHAHILVLVKGKLDYSVYDQEKRRKLEKKYGKGNIPTSKLHAIANNFLIDTRGSININMFDTGVSYVRTPEGEKIPASKISQEWYNATGCYNFHVAPITERKIRNQKTGKLELRTIESQVSEVIKYEIKSWEFENPEHLLYAWESVSGKRRVTKGGIFTGRGKDKWFSLLRQYNLERYFMEFYEENEDFDDSLEELEPEIFQILYDKQKQEYVQAEEIGSLQQLYKDKLLVSKVKGLRCKALNTYRLHFNDLKKQIGTIPNKEWIEKKQRLRDSLSFVCEEINDYFIRKSFLKAAKRYITAEPYQLDLFKDVRAEIKIEVSKLHPNRDISTIIV